MIDYEKLWKRLKEDLAKDASTLAYLAENAISDYSEEILVRSSQAYSDIVWAMENMEDEEMKDEKVH